MARVVMSMIVAAGSVGFASAGQFVVTSAVAKKQTPMAEVVMLINELAGKVEADGKSEQASYDKYACWCEDTLGRKAGDIANSKQTITDLSVLIEKLKAEIAVHGSEIQNLDKAIAANLAAQRDATEVRAGENEDYVGEKTESEQCIGALEAAVKVLNGAGAGKAGFLATMQEAQLLSVVAGVRQVLKRPSASRAASKEDLDIVQRFVEQPDAFMGRGRTSLSAAQIAQNPFGDYAPQSTQIQGILKGMYDSFAADLEKANADESEQEKAFQALMATKKAEAATLQATLERHTLDKAEKTKTEAQSQQARDDEQAQLAADEAFFEQTKAGCKSKASNWNERSRLRTEELMGMRKAIEILSSEDAKATFVNATTTFLQIKADDPNQKSWKHLMALSQQFQNKKLALMAAQLRSGGHFDKVIDAINEMTAILRAEEQDDIEHRDRCQGSQNKNKNDLGDLDHSIEKTDKKIERLSGTATELEGTIKTLEGEINATGEDMAEILSMRNKESAAFIQSLADDTDAIGLLNKAIVALNAFYKRNKIPLELVQQPGDYTVDPDKAPETNWKGAGYEGRTSESGGVIAILHMLAEDLAIEMGQARTEDASAQKEYLTQRDAMQTAVNTAEATKSATATELADTNMNIQEAEEFKAREGKDLAGETDKQAALSTDCAWVETHFESRRQKRKVEMAGLVDAKDYLAGVEAGTEVA